MILRPKSLFRSYGGGTWIGQHAGAKRCGDVMGTHTAAGSMPKHEWRSSSSQICRTQRTSVSFLGKGHCKRSVKPWDRRYPAKRGIPPQSFWNPAETRRLP